MQNWGLAIDIDGVLTSPQLKAAYNCQMAFIAKTRKGESAKGRITSSCFAVSLFRPFAMKRMSGAGEETT